MVIDVFYAIYTTCILDHDSRKVPVPSLFPLRARDENRARHHLQQEKSLHIITEITINS